MTILPDSKILRNGIPAQKKLCSFKFISRLLIVNTDSSYLLDSSNVYPTHKFNSHQWTG